jgi:hypothetical protein
MASSGLTLLPNGDCSILREEIKISRLWSLRIGEGMVSVRTSAFEFSVDISGPSPYLMSELA